MSTQPPTPHNNRLFKRVMLCGAAAAVVLFLWMMVMIVHFNAGPATVRLGTRTVLNLASVVLPGPVLLAFLAWQARYKALRVLAWAVVLPVVAVPAIGAVYTTLALRPLIGSGPYDAAVKESEAAALELINARNPAMERIKTVRERWKRQPEKREEFEAMAADLRASLVTLRDETTSVSRLRRVMAAPFAARGVSDARSDAFASFSLGRIDVEGARRSELDVERAIDAFAQRLELMIEHFGAWQWAGDDPVFSDKETAKAYDALIDKSGPAQP